MNAPRRWSWRRALGEGAVILASVYLAIFLEGLADQRGREADARAALVQLRAELESDRADLDEILAEQGELAAHYRSLSRWLAEPGAMPFDSVHASLERIAFTNRTMFPRRGAWASLLSSGLLTALQDPDLVTRLGNFYENINERLEYNGSEYDFNLNETMRTTLSESWDRYERRPIRDLTRLRNELTYIRVGWNAFYLGLLQEYLVELEGLMDDIDRHLGNTGGGGESEPRRSARMMKLQSAGVTTATGEAV